MMRVFVLSVVVAAVLAVSGAYGLSAVQQSIANAYIGDSVRFNQEERVNLYGREG
jgi:hypothetical protein